VIFVNYIDVLRGHGVDEFPEGRDIKTVLVTGATGNTGRSLVKALLGSSIEPIAALRSENSSLRLPENCSYRLCDFDRPDQLGPALQGIDAVFLLLPFHEKMVARAERFVAEATKNDVRFIVRLSGLGAAPDCGSQMGQLHGAIDACVKMSGIPWCILRCNSFMQNFSGHYRGMIRRGVLMLPEGDARSAFIDTRDIAAVAAHILARPSDHINQVYDLTGPTSLSNAGALEIISEVIGRKVLYRAISDAEARAAYARLGVPAWRVDVLESLSRYIRAGHADRPTGTVEAILGRPPGTFPDFARRHRDCWLEPAAPSG